MVRSLGVAEKQDRAVIRRSRLVQQTACGLTSEAKDGGRFMNRCLNTIDAMCPALQDADNERGENKGFLRFTHFS